jgi:hypothetical protein
VATEWTTEMQAQFEQLKEALTDVIKTELRGGEERLTVRLDEQLTKRLDGRLPQLEERLAVRLDEQLTRRLDERLPQLEERLAVRLDEQLTRRLDERLPQLEERLEVHLSQRFDSRFQVAEDRLSGQFKVAVEDVQRQVKLLGEAFGGTLDSIGRRIQTLEENVATTLKDHAKILSTHSHQIDEMNRRTGH